MLRNKAKNDKSIHNPNDDKQITPLVDYYYCFKSLDTISLEPTNQTSLKVPKDFAPKNKIIGVRN